MQASPSVVPFRVARVLPSAARHGDVVEAARMALTVAGFRVTRATPEEVVAESPRLRSTSENPLLGAGHLVVRVEAAEAVLEADLRGTRRLAGFAVLFPPALLLFLYAWFRSGMPMSKPPKDGMQLVRMAALYLPMGVGMALWIRWRTRAALERFLDSLVASARAGA